MLIHLDLFKTNCRRKNRKTFRKRAATVSSRAVVLPQNNCPELVGVGKSQNVNMSQTFEVFLAFCRKETKISTSFVRKNNCPGGNDVDLISK